MQQQLQDQQQKLFLAPQGDMEREVERLQRSVDALVKSNAVRGREGG